MRIMEKCIRDALEEKYNDVEFVDNDYRCFSESDLGDSLLHEFVRFNPSKKTLHFSHELSISARTRNEVNVYMKRIKQMPDVMRHCDITQNDGFVFTVTCGKQYTIKHRIFNPEICMKMVETMDEDLYRQTIVPIRNSILYIPSEKEFLTPEEIANDRDYFQ